jgi:hypothetical protein
MIIIDYIYISIIIKTIEIMNTNKTYEFSYKDNEGDLYESDQHPSLRDAKKEIEQLRKYYDGDFSVVETWIYQNGEFKGRF